MSPLSFLGVLGVIFHFYFIIDENHVRKRIAPDGMQRFAASHLGLICLPMSHKKDARLIWVKYNICFCTPEYLHNQIHVQVNNSIRICELPFRFNSFRR